MIVQYEVRDAENKLVGYCQLDREVRGREFQVFKKAYFTNPLELDHRMVLETECYVLAAFAHGKSRWTAFKLRQGQSPEHLPGYFSV